MVTLLNLDTFIQIMWLIKLNTFQWVQINVLMVNLFIHSAESATVTVTSQNSLDGKFLFQEGSKATLTCTIDPYGGILNWYYDGIKVAGCIGSTCSDVDTDLGAFQFQYNTAAAAGVFTWIISSVHKKYHDKICSCHDGSKFEPFTLTVEVPSACEYCPCIVIYLLVPLATLLYWIFAETHRPWRPCSLYKTDDNGEAHCDIPYLLFLILVLVVPFAILIYFIPCRPKGRCGRCHRCKCCTGRCYGCKCLPGNDMERLDHHMSHNLVFPDNDKKKQNTAIDNTTGKANVKRL